MVLSFGISSFVITVNLPTSLKIIQLLPTTGKVTVALNRDLGNTLITLKQILLGLGQKFPRD